MARFFNTAGPCRPEKHFMLPPIERLPASVPRLIERDAWFVLHAPRQSGKTTSLMALASKLTEEGRYAAVILSMQSGAALSHDVGAAEQAILDAWKDRVLTLPAELQPPPWPMASAGARIGSALAAWARHCPRPLVIFLDEIDALEGLTLASVLHQLRDRHPNRPEGFPASIALVGLRDLQDYKFASGGTAPPHPGSPSPFNILVESLTLRDFSREEIARLYAQHTADTGQVFSDEAIDRVYALSCGQPWLVNALASQMVEVIEPDPSRPIRAEHVNLAREQLLRRRDTHLKVLAERLGDPRIRPILEPLLSGQPLGAVPRDDQRFAIDLGLVRSAPDGRLEVANPIYRELLYDELLALPRAAMPALQDTWWMTGGRLDTKKLLNAFLEFWRKHGSALMATSEYPELAPHLVVFTFLLRVANGGGYVNREEVVERRRMDVYVQHGDVKLAVELKVWRPKEGDPLDEGLEQLERYMRHVGTEDGWLLIFDRRSGQPALIDRLRVEEATTPNGLRVVVVRS